MLRRRCCENENKIAEYVRNQLHENIINSQISLKESKDPVTGEKLKNKEEFNCEEKNQEE